MYYRDSKAEDPFRNDYAGCGGPGDKNLFSSYPKEAYSLLPSHPEMEMHAHASAVNFGKYSRIFRRDLRGGGSRWTEADEPVPRRRPSPGFRRPSSYSSFDDISDWDKAKDYGNHPDTYRTSQAGKKNIMASPAESDRGHSGRPLGNPAPSAFRGSKLGCRGVNLSACCFSVVYIVFHRITCLSSIHVFYIF